jgi:leucyl-tRNA synthetase
MALRASAASWAAFRVAADSGNAVIEAAALAHEKTIEWLAGKTPAKIIIVPGKLVNLVVK